MSLALLAPPRDLAPGLENAFDHVPSERDHEVGTEPLGAFLARAALDEATSVKAFVSTATVNCRPVLTSLKPRVRSMRSKSSELNRKSRL